MEHSKHAEIALHRPEAAAYEFTTLTCIPGCLFLKMQASVCFWICQVSSTTMIARYSFLTCLASSQGLPRAKAGIFLQLLAVSPPDSLICCREGSSHGEHVGKGIALNPPISTNTKHIKLAGFGDVCC